MPLHLKVTELGGNDRHHLPSAYPRTRVLLMQAICRYIRLGSKVRNHVGSDVTMGLGHVRHYRKARFLTRA